MRRCIRFLLLSVVSLLMFSSSVQACLFFPLFDPLNWCCGFGHANPYATRQIIDDWLGYGYMRGTQNGSLGHYPLQPWRSYTPMYPRMQAPMVRPMPMPSPFGMPMQSPLAMPNPYSRMPYGPTPYRPMPYGRTPFQPMPWHGVPQSDDCGCDGMLSGPALAPAPMQMPFGSDPCDPCNPCPQPLTQMPIPVQVPITTYRSVTVDQGGYQMVWVPRPVTQLVPQTSWQTQYMQPQSMQPGPWNRMLPMQMGMPAPMPMQMPMQMQMPTGGGCGDTPCASTTHAVPQYYSAHQQPSMSNHAAAGVTQVTAMRPGYPMTSPYPMTNYAAATQRPLPYSPYMPAQTVPNRMAMGDIYGDHEYPAAPATGMLPVVPNSYSGNVPVFPGSLTRSVGTRSVNRYPHVVR